MPAVSFDVLVLNSGEWLLGAELAASPWYILIYKQRGEPRNELHLWLPRQDSPRTGNYACKRFWVNDAVQWCVELPRDPLTHRPAGGSARVRFTAPDGRAFWADHRGPAGLADLSDLDLRALLLRATAGSFSGA